MDKDTRVLLQGVGYVRIEGAQPPFAFWDGERVIPAEISAGEPRERLKLELVNGLQLICSPEQELFTIQKGVGGVESIPCKNLTKEKFVRLTENVFEFDNLNTESYKYLSKLSHYELGEFIGLRFVLSVDRYTMDIPMVRRESYRYLESLFKKAEIEFDKEYYYKRCDRNKYTILNDEFLEELDDFSINEAIPELFWSSKLILKGFLKSLFTFSSLRSERFYISAKKDSPFLKDVQQALLLFGINSTLCRGLKVSQLIVFRHNCYRFADKIGVFNGEELFGPLDYKRFLEYDDRTVNLMRYSRVHSIDNIGYGKLFSVDSSQIMANGVILNNGRR